MFRVRLPQITVHFWRFFNYSGLNIGLLLGFCLIITSVVAQNPLTPIGSWREHLSYQQAIQVVKGNKIYCASQNAIFSVDATDGITRYSKITGLNDIGVKAFEYDATTQQLVIGYNNANLDVVKDGLVKNIGDIKRSGIAGN